MANIRKVLQQVNQFLRGWFERRENTEIPLDACVLEDRVLYSATIMPVDMMELQPDLAEQLDQLDYLIDQGLSSSSNTIVLPEGMFGNTASPTENDQPTDSELPDYSDQVELSSASSESLFQQGNAEQSLEVDPNGQTEFVQLLGAVSSVDSVDLTDRSSSHSYISSPLVEVNGADNELALSDRTSSDDALQDHSSTIDSLDAALVALDSELNSTTDSFTRTEIVFVDTGVADYQLILDDLRNQTFKGTHLEVALIDSTHDGLRQINDWLSSFDGKADAIHIISHGADRAVKLGDTWYDQSAVEQHEADFRGWTAALKEDADILFYGCNLASSQEGQAILQSIADWTGADIAASDDVVGNAQLGGDWLFEYQLGDVQTQVVVSAALQEQWNGLLATFTVTTTADSGAGSLRQAIIDANALAGADTITFNIAGAGVHTITVTTALPTITGQVTINATTESDFAGTPLIVLTDGVGSVTDGFRLGTGADGSTIRGFVIQGFTNGITLNGSGSHTIVGNYIGTSSSGNAVATNTVSFGISVVAGSNSNIIGGTTAADRNVISGNTQSGMWISGNNNTVRGNFIGVGSDGTTSLGNGWDAITIDGSNNIIGGTGANDGNILANSGDDGIEVAGSGTGNAFLRNIIYNNGSMAIDLGGNNSSPTINDFNDTDSGTNGLQNFPMLRSATSSGGNTTITGKINTTANTTYRVEFYSNAYGQAETTGYGEGRIYLGSTSVTTDANGNANFSSLLSGVTLGTGSTVTATATVDLGGGNFGSTSEFAGNILSNFSNLMVSGTYVGNGVDNRVVNALGFRPEMVMIMRASSTTMAMRTSSMVGDMSKTLGSASAVGANMIQGFTGEGFELGTDASVNTNGITYTFVAWGAGDYIDVGSYTGTGSALSINGAGFSPDLTYIMGAGATQAVYRGNQSTDTFDFANGSPIATGVTSLNADGFTLGTSTTVNSNGTTYYYATFDENANYLDLGSYTGNGTDNRNITTVGFEPEYVSLRALTGATFGVVKTESSGFNTDMTEFGNPNHIQAFNSNGFQIGSDGLVNTNTTNYAYIAFKQRIAPIIVDTTSDASDGTTTSLSQLLANRGADGRISLREAITVANASRNAGVVDNIYFNISGSGVQTILSTSALPTITEAVNLDAWTQPGFSSTPLIELNGNNAGVNRDALLLQSHSGSTIRGFIINRYTGDGIELNTVNSSLIEGNWIGLNNTGTAASANALRGLNFTNSVGLTIGGTSTVSRNVISGNTLQGILFDNVDNTFVYGNYIGTNATGTADINGTTSNTSQTGLLLTGGSSGNQIGNTSLAGARNIFSGNNNFGIEIQGSTSTNNTVVGNYIGTDVTGLVALGNVNGGFLFWGAGTGNLLGGNVISGNLNVGVLVGNAAASSTIQGNIIGLGANGSTILGNVGAGVFVAGASSNTLIGTNADGSNDSAEVNTISGNSDGVVVSDSGTFGTLIYGNYIGTDVSGLSARGNTFDGVRIQSGAIVNYVGGAGTSRRNIIAANGQDGVQIDGETTDINYIQNNWIGLAADGVTVFGNGGDGIYISGGADNTIVGGIGLGNVIMGSRFVGIEIDGASTGTSILGNFIGINAAGTVVHGSGMEGIMLENGVASTTIGGTTAGEGNTIVDSGRLSAIWQSGISITASAGASNSIIGNSIYDNRGLGIDIGATGVTANDNLDGDTGANNLQNTPILTAATTNGTTVTVSGSLNTVANTAGILIHFYATPAIGNVNTRQGRRYLGSTTVSTNASGNATFSNIALSSAVTAGEIITATTTLSSNTSEFSQGFVVSASSGNSTPTTSQLISTENGGLTINTSGYNTWLEAEDGSALLGGRTQLSMEFQFRATMPTDAFYSLASYTTPTDGDQLFLGAGKSGASEFFYLLINNQLVSINTDVDAFFDGNQHSIAFTWNQTAGAYAVYLDGALLGSGTGLATGFTFGAGGQFGLGLDLDVGADTWQPGALFQGTFKDVRIFSDVRTAAEIAASHRSDLPYNEGNMIANWRFKDLSTEGRTTNAVSGNDLYVRSLTTTWSNQDTPALQLRVDENSAAGSVIGQVQGIDIDREQRISSLLAADSSLRYNAETGKFYKVISSAGTWSAAQSGAMATTLNTVAGQLATIRSANENAFVTSMLTGTSWIGGNDSLNEGVWRWYNGTSANSVFWQGVATGYAVDGAYANFVPGEPNDFSGNEDFLEIDTGGRWNDNSSTATQSTYVVEWNADDVLDATNALTFSITSQSVSGAFAINSDTGVITVANGSLLNFESQTSHTITVRTTDGSGAFVDRNYTISLNNLTEENNAPTDLSSGINLNTDGGNNAYLMTSNGGSVLGGRTSLTMEFNVAIATNVTENMLVSYAVPSQDNEVLFRVGSNGAIMLTLDQTGGNVTTAAIAQLLDGKQHAIAFSWDNTAGDVRIYVDGQLVHTATGIKVGTTLDGGGTLVFGQEQDSINGGYNTSQRLSGTLYDVRVWDRAISDEQISLNYHQVPGSTETGLVANWRMSGLSGGNTVVDSVGGVNLTVANVAVGGGFTASTPTAGLTVSENATVGTRVGQLIATDVDLARDVALDGLFREAASPGSFATYTSGQTFGNWTVQSGDIDLIGTLWQSSPLGGRSIDLNGLNPGAIAQTLTTVAGRQYQVVFNASGNWGSGETTKDFRVSAAGTSQDFSLTQPTGWSTSNMLFSGRSMTFTATGSSSTLAFQSLDSGGAGAVIADVRVIEIPAAVSAILSNDATLSYDAGTGKFYRTVNSNVTWPTAQSAATSSTLNGVGGQLVTIGSRYENDLVWAMARNAGQNLWIGATDATTEGTWRWQSGSSNGATFWVGTSAGTLQAGQYANWSTGEPNDSGNQDYAQILFTTGMWDDDTNSNSRSYVVEWDASEVLSNYTYTITSNPSGAFAINSTTGEITVSNATPLNEVATNPTITVQVTDAAGNSYSEVMTISVTPVNDNTPVITSNGGGATASINVAENSTAVTTITATDADLPAPTLTYSIVGGADSALFSISSTTGQLSFISGRNFEAPADAGANNVYDVIVRVDDGTFWDDQSIAVTVTNVNEAPTDLYSVPNVTNANVLGYYSFSSANNLGRDDAGDNQSMTLFGSPTQTTRSGGSGALDLAGGASGQYGNIASMTTGGAMTLAAWVRFDSTSANGWERVIDLGQTSAGGIGNIFIGREWTTNNLTFTVEKSGNYTYRATLVNGITNGTWMHVAATVDASGSMILYVNGTAVANTTGVAPDVGVRTNHFVGRSNYAADGYFDGAIDDLIITNGAMSAAAVSALYQQTAGFNVAENAANTTLVGTLLATDPDAGNTYTYTLTNNAGGRFSIDSTTGQITVANGSLLNFEAVTSHTITAQVTDQNGLTYSEDVTINVSNVNEAPTTVADTAIAVEAGGTANSTAGTNPTGNVLTNDTDVDAGDTKTVSGVAAGVVGSASTNVGSSVSGTYGSITIAANGSYTYTVNNSNATVQALAVGQSINDVFTYTMQDAGGLTSTTQITVTIQGANDAPVQASIEGTALSYNENAGAVAITSTIAITDVDDTNIESAVVAITANYVNGQDVLGFTNQNGITGSWNATTGELTLTGSATVAQYQAALRSITYTNSSETPSTLTRTVSFTVNDGSANSNTQTRDISVTAANDAPVLDNTRTPVLQSVSEHAGPPVGAVGTLVSSLIDFATPSGQVDNVTDVDTGATTGIAITATNAVNGTWWYSTDNGSNWQRIGNVSDASARLLAADSNTRIYFEPTQSTEFSGTISNAITFRAWDQTSGTNGGTGNATANGGTTSFSSATDTAAITVNNVNDAPRILGDELITNGDFTTNLSGWTTSGSVAAASGRANFGLSNLVGPHSISQTISTVAGQTYQLSFDYLDGSSTLNQSLVASVTGSGNLLTTAQLVTDVATTAPGTRYTFTFVADSSTATITLTDTSDQSGLSNGTANVDGMVDNVSVRQLAGQMGTLNYTENAGPVAIHSTLSLSDFDSTNLVGATIQFASGFIASQDLLSFTNQLGITGNYNSTTGVLTLSGSASVADYQTALRSITYANTSESPTGSRSLSFTVDDGSLTSTVATRSIAISAVNDTPNAVADTATAVEAGGILNGTAGTNPTGNVLTNDTDVDASDTKTVNGVAAGVQASATGSVGSAVAGSFGSISIASDGSYTYTVDNSNASVQALRTSANTLQDIFTYTMRDAAGLTSTTQITVTIQGANDAPSDLALANPSGTNLITNGSFETNNGGANTASWGPTVTVSGWTAIGGEGFEIWNNSNNGGPATASDGISRLELNVGSGAINGISQNVSTANGQAYVLSFDLSSRVGFPNSEIQVYWRGDLVGTIAQTEVAWRTHSFVVTGSGGSDELRFMETATNNASGSSLLDNVRLIAENSPSISVAENASNGTVVALAGARDVDTVSIDTRSYSLTNNAGGRFSIDATTGIITVADGSLLNFEAAPSHAITVRVTDASNLTYDENFTIAVTNVNETPTAVVDTATAVEAGGISNGSAGTNPAGNVLTNDTDIDAVDTKTVTGVAAGVQVSATGSVASAVTGTFGSISIAADGSYTYTVDNSNASVQALRTTANTLTDVFTYTMRDAAGLTSTTQITVTIQGANDTPVSVADSAIAVEAGGVGNSTAGTNPTGNVLTNDTDVDSVGNGETKAVTGVAAGIQASASGNVATAVTGTYGSLSIASSGAYTYTVNNANADVQALRNSGQTLTDVFTYTMTDAAGATSSTQITLTIQGANDAPVQSSIEGTPLSYTEGAGAVAISSTLALDDVDDANLSSATVQISSNYRNGEDLLSFTNQNGISGSWDALTGTMTLTGSATKAQYQAALRSITYTNLSEVPNTSTRTVSFAVSDGDLVSSSTSRDISISSINDAPVNLVPGALVTGVNTTLTLSGANAIQVSDVDAVSNNVRVTLTAASGTLTLSSTSGLTFTTGDGTNDSTIVVTGTIANINAALDGMQFAPTGGFTGTASITLQTEDLGNTGTGGNLSDTDVITVQVGGLRFQEGVNGYTGTQDTYVSSAATSTAYGNSSSVLVDDPSQHGLIRFDNIFGSGGGQIAFGSTITSATLSIYVTGTDALDIVNVHRMLSAWAETSTWSSLTNGVQANNVEASTTVSHSINAGVGGWVTITGLTSTVQAWSDGAANQGWALLSNGADNWTFHSSEFGTVSLRPYLTVAFTAPQSADIDLDANNSSGSTGSGFTRTWTENGGPLTIADSDATISDLDSSNLQSMTISISNRQDGTAELLAANTTGTSITASYNSSTGVLTLSGSDTVANYQQVLRTVTYNNTSESPSTVARLITVQAADAYVSSNLATATINVVSVNDAPVLDSAGDMVLTTITEDAVNNAGNSIASIIGSASGDRITDVDAGAVEGIALTGVNSGNGYWQYSTNSGASWTNVGTVDNTSALLLRSTDLLRFVPNEANSTAGNITFRAWDQTSGTVGTKVDTSSNGGTTAFSTNTEIASITVTAVNDTPVAVSDSATAVEAGGVSNGTAGTNPTGNVLTNDTDVDSGDTRTVTGVASGTQVSASGSVGSAVTGLYGSINLAADGSYTYAVNNTNATVQALANSGQSIQDVFTYTITDGAGATSSTQITVTIQGANDAPTITSNGGGSTAAISLAENITGVTSVVGNDVDAGTSLTYSIIGGADAARFSITAGGSLAFVTAPDFEAPSDAGGNNVYDVIVQVSDGSLATTQSIAVTITDVSNFLVVTTETDNNDSGITTGASYNIEWLNANRGVDASVSLREAIIAANNTAGTDTVNFNISGSGVKTINMASVLPAITDTIVINGFSQTGSSANTLTTGNDAVLNIVLNGAGAGAGANGLTLSAGSAGSTISGLVINNFSQYGISVTSGNNTIAGNIIGLNQSGTAMAANSYGIYINNAANNTIGGTAASARNIISGNTNDGVYVTGALATSNLIQGNYIGTNAAGTAAVSNGAMGIRITSGAAGNTIGGATAGAGNLISGNANSGVYIDASNTTIKGNLIGTNAAGTGAIRNGSLGSATGGIFIASGSGSVIGGTTAADRNVIAGNGGAGIWIEGTTGAHTIQGNYVGVDITGDTALANTRWGIVLNTGAMTNIQIGGTATGAGNVISGNEASTGGVFIGGNSSGTVLEGNRIGVGATTNTALSTVQAVGVRVQASASNTRIGGTVAGSGNVIARNGSTGVTIVGNTSGTTIQGNAIYGNNGLAIDLGGDGTTSNDGMLTAGQPNQLMDRPVLSNANLVGNNLTLSGFVGSAANQSVFANSRVEFYKTTAASSVFLGALTTDANGNFSGTLDVTGLGLSQSDPIIATATDPNGNTSEFSTSFEANAAPTANSDSNTAIEAGGVLNASAGTNPSGNVLTNDTDPNSTDTKTVSGVAAGTIGSAAGSVGASVSGAYGSIQIAANGSYTYTVNNSNAAVQALRTSGNTLTDVFTYTMADAGGLTSTTQITITIQGANDAPVGVSDTATATEAGGVANGSVGSNPTGNVLTNDTDVDAGDTKTVSGVAAGVQGSAAGSVGSSVTGSYGSITINADGSYSYAVDNSNSAVQALRTTANTLQDVFTYTMVDSGGLSSTTQITVTIQGQNDVPHDLSSGSLTVNENAANGTVVGSITAHDLDSGDLLTYSLTDSAGGRFEINALTGQVTVADGSLLNFEALQSHNITVRVTDTAGTSYEEQFTINLGDVNETPASVSDSNTAVEAGGVANGSAGTNPTGNVLTNDTDVDAGDTKTVSGVAAGVQGSAVGAVGSSVAGSYGSITINADGSYSYAVDNSNAAVQALRTTANTLQDVFTYTMVDSGGLSSTTQITVTIQGQNDNPVAVSDSTLAVEAGGYGNGTSGTNPTGNVLANDTDVDASDTRAVSGVASGVQANTTGSVGSSVTGAFGWITINSDGSYSYTVDNSNATVQALRTAADTITDVFSYTVTDIAGATSTTQITVTIQGRNDAPGAVNDTPTAVEAGGVNNGSAGTNPTGNLLSNDVDVDSGDSKTVTGIIAGSFASATGSVGSSVTGSYGSITVNADGTYSYVVDNSNAAVQALRTTANTLQDVFTYTMQDAGGLSSTATVTITIEGANDAPVAVGNTATAVEAGGVLNNISGSDPTGNVLTNDTDVDAGDTRTVVGVAAGNQASASGNVGSSVSGSYGSIQIAANGVYTYSLDNNNAAVEALNGGQTLTETFTYTVSDTAGATSTTTIVITIQGVDDLPFAIVDMDTAVEAGGVNNSIPGTSPSGNVLSNDIAPNGQTVIGVTAGVVGSASGSVGVAVAGLYGTVVLNADGTYTYTIDNSNAAVQALRVSSDHLTDLFTYTMEDGLGYQSTTQLTITLDGRSDAAVANNDTAVAVEAGGVANASAGSNATGNVLSNDTDVDAGDTKAVIGVAAGAQASAAGNVGASLTGTYGSIVVNADGSYSYTVNNNHAAVQALRTASDTLQEVFTYTMEDTAGLASTATVTITIQGANDTPVAVSDNAFATEAGGTLNGTAGSNPSGNVLSNDTDVDSGDTKAVSGVAAGSLVSASGNVGSSVTGSYGAITINADGSYSYAVDNSNAAVQALRTAGDTLQDVFTYTMTDTAGATSTTQITVTIQGANDAAVLTADTADAVEAGGYGNATSGTNPSGNVLSNDSDVDAGDSMLVTGVVAGTSASAVGSVGTSVTGAYGSIVIGNNGSYTYTVDNTNAAVQALLSYSDTLTDTFTYTVTDAAGATTTTQIVVTVRGQNDGPTSVADNTVAVEAGGVSNGAAGTNPTGIVLSNDTDLDSGDTKTVSGVVAGLSASAVGSVGSSVAGSYGSITINSDGSYSYVVDNSNATVPSSTNLEQYATRCLYLYDAGRRWTEFNNADHCDHSRPE